MISHHLADIMTGETLESMFVIIYRRHQKRFTRQAEMESASPHLDSSVCCDDEKKKADKQKTQTQWQNHTV